MTESIDEKPKIINEVLRYRKSPEDLSVYFLYRYLPLLFPLPSSFSMSTHLRLNE